MIVFQKGEMITPFHVSDPWPSGCPTPDLRSRLGMIDFRKSRSVLTGVEGVIALLLRLECWYNSFTLHTIIRILVRVLHKHYFISFHPRAFYCQVKGGEDVYATSTTLWGFYNQGLDRRCVLGDSSNTYLGQRTRREGV